ncbi:MAG: hypothetical protein IKI93_08825 [Clostridia bacterium]|nr:hypothetical protein [Clostridia bacterium]
MKKSVQTIRSVTGAYDRFKKSNPLMMRKKFAMKDVLFRRDQPDTELMRAEFAFDVELYVILVALLVGSLCLVLKTVRFRERRRTAALEKALIHQSRR